MIAALQKFEIPGVIEFKEGLGGLARARVQTQWSQAELYLHGAQVTRFQKHGEPPLLFLSERARFEPGKAIRGGIPICFPWFGSRAGDVAHGFARLNEWEVTGTSALPRGAVQLHLRLPELPAAKAWPSFSVEYRVSIGQELKVELAVTNCSSAEQLEFEACLHSYFTVGNVSQIAIHGLRGTAYHDKLAENALRTETNDSIQISSQTDRSYFRTTAAIEVSDPVLKRIIRIEKTGSASTVVWNPWTTQILSDLGPEEYRRMVCVESGNVESDRLRLAPGQSSTLEVGMSSRSMT